MERLQSKAQDQQGSEQPEDEDYPRLSLRQFTKEAYVLATQAERFVDNWHIDCVTDHLQACSELKIKKLIINIPPGFGKSTMACVCWPSWEWTLRPPKQFLFGAYHERLSNRDSKATRDLINTSWYQARWGQRFRFKDDANKIERFDNTRGGFRMATTVGGFAVGEHVDISLIDDPIDVERAKSMNEIAAANYWYDKNIPMKGNNPESYVQVVVMQRLHKIDLAGHLYAQGGWELLRIPMRYKPARPTVTSLGWRDPRTKEDELAWPGFFTPKVVEDQRNSLGADQTACQHEQDPVDSKDKMFNENSFCWFDWDREPETETKLRQATGNQRRHPKIDGVFILRRRDGTVDRFLASECTFFQTFDTAMKAGEENCYTVGVVAGITPLGDLLILYVYRDKIAIPDQWGMIVNLRARFPFCSWQSIEPKASGIGLLQLSNLSSFPLRELKVDGDKKRRAQPLATLCRSGKVFLLTGSAWATDFILEHCEFNHGDYDDQVDATAYAAQDMMEHAGTEPRVRSFGAKK